MNLDDRRAVTQQTLDTYRGRTLEWDATTCVHMAHDHLTAMGHDLPGVPNFTTPVGAARALKRNGWESAEAMLDDLLERIAPARMIIGDLAVVEGQDGLASILICAGPLKLMGWHTNSGDFVVWDDPVSQLLGAWRA